MEKLIENLKYQQIELKKGIFFIPASCFMYIKKGYCYVESGDCILDLLQRGDMVNTMNSNNSCVYFTSETNIIYLVNRNEINNLSQLGMFTLLIYLQSKIDEQNTLKDIREKRAPEYIKAAHNQILKKFGYREPCKYKLNGFNSNMVAQYLGLTSEMYSRGLALIKK